MKISYYQSNHFLHILEVYEQQVCKGDTVYMEAEELVDIAEYYIKKYRDIEAYQCVDYGLSLHPGNVDLLIFKARDAMAKGRFDEAERIKSTIADQSDCEVIYLSAELLINQGNTDEASEMLHQYWNSLADVTSEQQQVAREIAHIYLDYGYADEAQSWLERLPENSDSLNDMACMRAEYLCRKGDYDAAIQLFNKLLDNDPHDEGIWLLMADCYYGKHDYAHAHECLDFVFALSPQNVEAILLKANCYWEQRQYEDAHLLYQQYVTLYDDNPTVHMMIGMCLTEMELYVQAEQAFNKAEQSTVDAGMLKDIYIQQALLASYLGKSEVIQSYLEKLLAVGSSLEDLAVLKSEIQIRNGDQEDAVSHIINVFSTLDKISIAVPMLDLLVRYDFIDDCQTCLTKWKERNHNTLSGALYTYEAYCYYQKNDIPQFLSSFKNACAYDRKHVEEFFGPQFGELVRQFDINL